MAWPTTNDPKTEFVTLRLTVGEAADLDVAAANAGERRSSYVRAAVEEKIARDQQARAKTRKKSRGKVQP